MILHVCGVLSDHLGRVLLVENPETGSLVAPGRPLPAGELPPDALAQHFRLTTGLIVMPVRLAGMTYEPEPVDRLTLVFRCIMRGGDLRIPEGQNRVGFFDGAPLPVWLSGNDRLVVEEALRHPGGPPFCRRAAAGTASQLAGESWRLRVCLALRDADDRVLWRRGPDHLWRLPCTVTVADEAPWESAAQLLKENAGRETPDADLPLVVVTPERAEATFLFSAPVSDGLTGITEARSAALFAPGGEPGDCIHEHRDLLSRATGLSDVTRFDRNHLQSQSGSAQV